MKIITFSGVDGSGKSTQLKLLKNHLEQNGKKVAYFHAVEFSLANRLSRAWKGEKNFEAGKETAVTTASFWLIHARVKFLFLDVLRFRFLLRRLEKEQYEYLLSDRYFFDSLINLEFLSQATSRFSQSLLQLPFKLLEKAIPQPEHAFYLRLPVAAIMSRARIPEQGSQYLEKKLFLFDQNEATFKLEKIDAQRDPQSIATEIAFRSL